MSSYYKAKLKRAMQSIGTYKKEYDQAIAMLSEMLTDYDEAVNEGGEEKFITIDSGKVVKNPMYAIKEKLRADILVYLRELGLTPAGLKKIQQDEAKEGKSKLAEVLGELSGNQLRSDNG